MEAIARGINRRTEFTIDDSLIHRFKARILVGSVAECWPWLGAVRNGYGAIKHCRKILGAHVVAWAIAQKRMPQPGYLICHTCDNRVCCNPSHLYEGTAADNVRDADHRRSIARAHGQQCYNAILNSDIVELILALHVCKGWGYLRISHVLQVSQWAVKSVVSRKSWRRVPMPSEDRAAELVREWTQGNSDCKVAVQ